MGSVKGAKGESADIERQYFICLIQICKALFLGSPLRRYKLLCLRSRNAKKTIQVNPIYEGALSYIGNQFSCTGEAPPKKPELLSALAITPLREATVPPSFMYSSNTSQASLLLNSGRRLSIRE